MLEDERVQAVLGRHDVAHLRVLGHDSHAADAPVEGEALAHETVEVHGLVGSVEIAQAEVDDSGAELRAVVRGGVG